MKLSFATLLLCSFLLSPIFLEHSMVVSERCTNTCAGTNTGRCAGTGAGMGSGTCAGMGSGTCAGMGSGTCADMGAGTCAGMGAGTCASSCAGMCSEACMMDGCKQYGQGACGGMCNCVAGTCGYRSESPCGSVQETSRCR